MLEGHGVRNHVIDPASLQVDRRVRRAKTDRIDAARPMRSLMAHARGEPKVWSVLRALDASKAFGPTARAMEDPQALDRVVIQAIGHNEGGCRNASSRVPEHDLIAPSQRY